jgi:hypothetical protein
MFVWEAAVLFYVNEKPNREIFKEVRERGERWKSVFNPLSIGSATTRNERAAHINDHLTPHSRNHQQSTLRLASLAAPQLYSFNKRPSANPNAAVVFTDSLKPFVDVPFTSKKEDLVMSYTPTQNFNTAIIDSPSFTSSWYAVAYTWQISGYDSPIEASLLRGNDYDKVLPLKTDKDGILKPFAFKLWNEPMVIYRDSEGQPVCVTDV